MKLQSVDWQALESIFFSVGMFVDFDEPTEMIEMESYYGKAIPMELMNIDNWCTVEKITESIHQWLDGTQEQVHS